MSNNQFAALNVPATDGVGASASCANLGPLKTFVVDGAFKGNLILQISGDGTNFVDAVRLLPGDEQPVNGTFAASHVRIRREQVITGGDLPVVSMGSALGVNDSAALTVPAADGTGAATNVATTHVLKTLCVSGSYDGNLFVEASADAGTTWDPIASFLNGETGVKSVGVVVNRVRVRRNRVTSGLPVVTLSSCGDASDATEIAGLTANQIVVGGATGLIAQSAAFTFDIATGLGFVGASGSIFATGSAGDWVVNKAQANVFTGTVADLAAGRAIHFVEAGVTGAGNQASMQLRAHGNAYVESAFGVSMAGAVSVQMLPVTRGVIGTYNATGLHIGTNNTTRIQMYADGVIDIFGSVGDMNWDAGNSRLRIGTVEATVQSYRLALFNSGGCYCVVRNTSSDVEMQYGCDSGTGVIGTSTNHSLELKANNSTKVTITTAGYVGIGAVPTQPFNVTFNTGKAFTISTDGGVGVSDNSYGSRIFVYNASATAIEMSLVSADLGRTNLTNCDYEIYDSVAARKLLGLSRTIADGDTAMSITRNVGATITVQQVSMGAADSGGAGFKVLRVPN